MKAAWEGGTLLLLGVREQRSRLLSFYHSITFPSIPEARNSLVVPGEAAAVLCVSADCPVSIPPRVSLHHRTEADIQVTKEMGRIFSIKLSGLNPERVGWTLASDCDPQPALTAVAQEWFSSKDDKKMPL